MGFGFVAFGSDGNDAKKVGTPAHSNPLSLGSAYLGGRSKMAPEDQLTLGGES